MTIEHTASGWTWTCPSCGLTRTLRKQADAEVDERNHERWHLAGGVTG